MLALLLVLAGLLTRSSAVTPTIMPTTTAQLSPSTSTTSTSSTPTTTALSASPGLYSFSFSFRRKLSNYDSSFTNPFPITRVYGAPLLNYTSVALSQDASKWIAISDEGLTFISLDFGVTFQEGVTLKGYEKVKITSNGEVVFVPKTLTANGYTSSTTLLIFDSPERLLHTASPSSAPTEAPVPHQKKHNQDEDDEGKEDRKW